MRVAFAILLFHSFVYKNIYFIVVVMYLLKTAETFDSSNKHRILQIPNSLNIS